VVKTRVIQKSNTPYKHHVFLEYTNIPGFVPKITWTKESEAIRSDLMARIQGQQHLMNSFERLEEKVEGLHAHYNLILQEKGNKRLKTLIVIRQLADI
jgi:hypothetical protein